MNIARSHKELAFSFIIALSFVLFIGSLSYSALQSEAQQAMVVQATTGVSDVHIEAESAVLKKIGGETLYEKNASAQLPLASITKVLLVLVAAEVLSLDEILTISRDAVIRGEGGLTAGEEWRVRDLIELTLVSSSNVGAEALSEYAEMRVRDRYPEATTPAVVWRMNTLAQEIGMQQAYFLNPTGLDVSTTHAGAYASARDVTLLFEYAYRNFSHLFSSTLSQSVTVGPLNGSQHVSENTNDAIPSIPGLVMGKTGYTDLAGGNLGIVFEAGPSQPYIAVVLQSSEEGRFVDIRALIDSVINR